MDFADIDPEDRSSAEPFLGPVELYGPVDGPHPGSEQAQHAAERQLTALVGLLNEERRVVERLLFKLAECRMLVQAEEHRFVAMATDEVVDAEEQLGLIEAARAMLVADICELLGVRDDDATLGRLAESAPQHLRGPLEEHAIVLRRLLAEVADQVRSGSDEFASRFGQVTAALERFESVGTMIGYGPGGFVAEGEIPPTRFDESA